MIVHRPESDLLLLQAMWERILHLKQHPDMSERSFSYDVLGIEAGMQRIEKLVAHLHELEKE